MAFSIRDYAQEKEKEQTGQTGQDQGGALQKLSSFIRGIGSQEEQKQEQSGNPQQQNGFSIREYAGKMQQIPSDVDAWMNDVSKYGKDIYADYFMRGNDSGYMDYQSPFQFDRYVTRNRYYSEQLNQRGQQLLDTIGTYDPEMRSRIMEAMGQINDINSALADESEYWKQFKDEDSYYAYAHMLSAANAPNQEDFEEKSRYVPTKTGDGSVNWLATMLAGEGEMVYDDYGYEDPLYDWINGDEEAGIVLRNIAAQGGSGETGNIHRLSSYFTEGQQQARQLTDDERKIYNYIHATQGAERATEYYEALLEELNARYREEDSKYWKEFAEKNQVGASVTSVLMSPFKGLGYFDQLVDYATTGKIDQNDPHNRVSWASNSIRSAVSEKIENGWGGKVGSELYGIGMSVAENVYLGVLSGVYAANGINPLGAKVAEWITLGVMGSGAAADSVIAAKDRGLTDDQAIVIGSAAGVIEMLTEKIGMDTFLDNLIKGESVAKFFVKQGGSEGLEEGLGNVLNYLVDAFVAGDKSEFATTMKQYKDNGYSDIKAITNTLLQQGGETLKDAARGFASGIIMAGGGMGVQYAFSAPGDAKTGSMISGDKEAIEDLITTGYTMPEGSAARNIAERYGKQYFGGKQLSDIQLGRMWREVAAEDSKQPQTKSETESDQPGAGVDMEPGQAEKYLEILERYNTDFAVGERNAAMNALEEMRMDAEKNGKNQDPAENPAATRQKTTAATIAQTTGERGKQVIQELYRQGQRLTNYADEFSAYYNAGVHGADIKSVKLYNPTLTWTQKNAVYNAGKADAQQSLAHEVKESKLAFNRKDAGLNYDGLDVKAVGKVNARVLDRSAKALGVRVRMENLPAGKNGYVDGNGDIVVSYSAKEPLLVVAAHEFTHRMQQLSPKSYREYRDFVTKAIEMESETGLQGYVEKTISDYKNHKVNLSYEAALDEIVSNYAMQMMKDGKLFTDLVKENMSLGQRLLRSLKSLIAKVKNALTGNGLSQEQRTAYGTSLKTLEEAAKKWQKAYEQAVEDSGNLRTLNAEEIKKMNQNASEAENTSVANSENGEKNTASESGKRYAIDDSSGRGSEEITLQDVQILRRIGRKSVNEFTSDDIDKAKKWAKKFYQELGVKSPFFRAWFGDWRSYDTKTKVKYIPLNTEYTNAKEISRRSAYNSDTEWTINVSRNGIDETANKNGKWSAAYHSLANIQEMLENAVLLDTASVGRPSNRIGNNVAFVHSMYCPVTVSGEKAIAKLYVTEEVGDKNTFYLVKIEMVPTDSTVLSYKAPAPNSSVDTDISVSELYKFVKRLDERFEAESDNPIHFNPKEANPVFLNEDGTPKVFYHVSKKNGGFTVFRDWNYFTEQKRYAERYAERWNQKSLYEVYLTADKIFDTRDEDAARIFESIRQEYGLGELQDTGLPDWTDGFDITEYLSEHPELGYDAVFLDEGGDLVNGEPVSRGISIVIKDSIQIKSATDNIGTFDGSNPDIRFSVDDTDSQGNALSEAQQEYFKESKVRDEQGRLLVLYHQTDGDFTIFDTRHPGAGSRDSGTPFGIFLKKTAGDIGLAGKKQMALYANITNPLRAENREDFDRQFREISGSYSAISDKHKQLDAEYHEKFEQAKKAWRDYIIEWRAANPDANRSALYDDPKFNELFDAEDNILDEWTEAADLLSTQAKEAITQDLRAAGYDGVFLENDVGSWGRRTDAIIALDPQQVKNISNKTPTSNPDIRYSVDDEGSQQAQQTQEQKPAEPKKKIRPVAESRPLIAKKDLRSTVLNLFSTGERNSISTSTDTMERSIVEETKARLKQTEAERDRNWSDLKHLQAKSAVRSAEQEARIKELKKTVLAQNKQLEDQRKALSKAIKTAERDKALADVRMKAQKDRNAAAREKYNAKLKEVMQTAREDIKSVKEQAKADVKAAEQEGRQNLAQYRESRKERDAIERVRARVEENVSTLTRAITAPTKELHVPSSMQKPISNLLQSLDFTSRTMKRGGEPTIRDVKYTRALQAILDAVDEQTSAINSDDGNYTLDIPPDFKEFVKKHMKTIEDAAEGLDLETNRVYDMGSDELRDLDHILSTIVKAIRDIDVLHMAGAKARVSDAAMETRKELGSRPKVKTDSGNALLWNYYTPTYAFERMGRAATQILNGLKEGQAKLAKTISDVIQFANKTYTGKEVRAWESNVQDIELDSGETVRMTTAQIMSLYCLAKREQALGHMFGAGIRVSTFKEGLKEIVQKQHYLLTENDLNKISGLLDERQKAVADALQNYMNTVGKDLGNEISFARWDYAAFTEENYFPITTDAEIRDARNPDQERANLWALINKSFTKQLTKNANNAIVVSSIFDVFAQHMSDMAEYNAFALPLVDAMKWFNYRETVAVEGTQIKTWSVQKTINDALGTAAGKYFIDLMTDINSSQKAGRHENLLGKMMSRFKGASVGWNLRVAVQQPTAILRASSMIEAKYLVKGTARIKTKAIVEEMNRYSGIALWKSLGYYDLNVARSVTEQIKHDSSIMDKLNDAGMWLPGKMDEITWARIWAACKEKTAAEKKLTGEALMKETAKLFDDVCYHTQVADSVLTRNSYMRSKTQAMKELTAFMAEPTMSMNILLNAFSDYQQITAHKGKAAGWSKAKTGIMIGLQGYALSSIVNAIVTAAMDAWRDDDDYERYGDKFKQALLGEENFFDGNLFSELNPLEKIMFVKDILSYFEGYDNTPSYMQMVKTGKRLCDDIKNLLSGKGRVTAYGALYDFLQLFGYVSGSAPASLSREVVSLWNSTVGAFSPEKKVKRYSTQTKEAIKNAYMLGALTFEEAVDALKQDADMDSGEAYDTVSEWKFKKENPGTDITGSAAEKYYLTVLKNGVSASDFYDIYENIKEIKNTSSSKKEDVVDFISELDLDDDALEAIWNAVKGNWSDKGTPWE